MALLFEFPEDTTVCGFQSTTTKCVTAGHCNNNNNTRKKVEEITSQPENETENVCPSVYKTREVCSVYAIIINTPQLLQLEIHFACT